MGWLRWRCRAARELDLAMAAEGQVSRPECEKLVELARGTAPGSVIVEIGTYRGRSTIALALGARQGARNRVYAIDPHLEFHGVLGGEFGPEDQAALYANLARAGVGALVSVVGLASAAVARGWSEQNVGLLWIDGDHRYEAVRADCDAWWRFVTPGGTIAFHDADTPDVRRIIGELREQGRIAVLGEMGRLLWSRRPA